MSTPKVGQKITLLPRDGVIIAIADSMGKDGRLAKMYVAQFGNEMRHLYAEEFSVDECCKGCLQASHRRPCDLHGWPCSGCKVSTFAQTLIVESNQHIGKTEAHWYCQACAEKRDQHGK